MENQFTVENEFENTRLDQYLSSKLNVSRNQIANLIKKECIQIDGKNVAKAGLKLKESQRINIDFPELQTKDIADVDFENDPLFNIQIIYEDDDILVINKPINLIVHDAPSVSEPTLVDWLKYKNISLSTISGEERHGIVHRLDKGTSGAMVIAKNNKAHEMLSNQLQDKSMGRYYMAIIDQPLKDHTIIDQPLGRSVNNRLKISIREDGKQAKTAFAKVSLSNDEKQELIFAKLYTGRTHQIRAHLNYINRHILGDVLYDFKGKLDNISRIYLHAYNLYLIHPTSGEKMIFNANLDGYFTNYLQQNFNMETSIENIDQNFIDKLFNSFV